MATGPASVLELKHDLPFYQA